ncbi:stimulated by retinoic acid gene 6 protein-like isoform X2 [Hemicordylus capensis]|uniref:stimulated by retinoic acid gene 6 protein-like isoform X2 n=1 Tax=Hemicordylus capensis TaxID=884348 RepID=UPI0023043DF5|nr:stimulated by retinoic acid gene 6 protein-like isoform X2 [Hemicordylus capensis]
MGNITDTEEGELEEYECESLIHMEDFLHYSLVPAVIIVIVLSCLETRTRRWGVEEKLQKLSGHGAFLIPFDFVTAFNNRWSFGFAFGSTADRLMFLFTQEYLPTNFPGWAKVFFLLLVAIEVGLSSYPFFVCLSTSNKIIGATLGFLYTATWLIVMVLDMKCPQGQLIGAYEDYIIYWPSLLCQTFLLGRFLHILVKALTANCRQDTINEETLLLEVHQAQHVQQLMRKPPVEQSQKSWIRRKIYAWDPYFRFPSRMITTAVVILICLYMFISAEYMLSMLIIRQLKDLKSILEELVSHTNASQEMESFLIGMEEFNNVTEGVWISTTVMTSLTSISFVFRILTCYRKHIKLLRAGKKHLFMSDDYSVSPSLSVVALGKYTSWQIAFSMWGYLVIHLVLFVAGMVLMYLVILPMKHGQWMQLLNKWGLVILSLVIIMGVKQLQVLMASQFFLQQKISPNDKQKPLALDNRKAFQNFSYFLFFFSVAVGLTSCLIRLLWSIVIGAWLIGRIDRAIMPQGFERFDKGFKTWIGMLFVDHYHTNPVLVCFCYILVTNGQTDLQRVTTHMILDRPKRTAPRVSAKARTRWLLFYTLLKNPDLMKLRKKPKPDSHSVDLSQPPFAINI